MDIPKIWRRKEERTPECRVVRGDRNMEEAEATGAASPLRVTPQGVTFFGAPSPSTGHIPVPTPSPAPVAGGQGRDGILGRACSQTQRLPFIYPESPYPPASPELPSLPSSSSNFFVPAIDSVHGHAVPFLVLCFHGGLIPPAHHRSESCSLADVPLAVPP